MGEDFFLAFSPERVDPGRTDWTTKNTPKVIGGLTDACTERASALYRRAIDTLVPVSSPDAAELVKLLENIFRSVNIALVNELAQLCDRMNLDVWEVVEAAGTKPFGFMRFKPGPGLGGHCLPVDPFYLAWKAREYDFYTEFIELAGKVNENMPYFCLEKITRALNGAERSVRGSRVHLVGVSYKEDVGDLRESPALKLIELLRAEGAEISYTDEHVPRAARARAGLGRARRCARECGLRRHRHCAWRHRLRGARRGGPPRGRPSQRHGRGGLGERQRVEAVVAQVGLGPWGGEPRQELQRARPPEVALRPRSVADRPAASSLSRDGVHRPLRGRPRGSRGRRGRHRDARAHSCRAREASAADEEARPGGEADGAHRRGGGRARRAGRCRRARPHARPPAPLPPRRGQAEGARRRQASSARSSTSTATGRTWERSAATRTRSGAWACTISR